MKADSISDAEKQAESYLKNFKEKNNYSDLEKSLDLNNTDSSIIYEYLNYWKQKEHSHFLKELKKYKYFLDQESCAVLGVKYINHQEDVFNLINSVQKINFDKLDFISIKNNLEKFLNEYYSKEDKEILEQKCDKRINNLPLYKLENNIMFYLAV